jgi:endoglucanase
MNTRITVAALLVLALAAAPAGAAGAELPARFARGVNVSGWFWGSDWDKRPYTDADFALIRSAGFTYVRIPIDFQTLHDPAAPAELRRDATDRLLDGLRTLRRHDLGALVDIHQATPDGMSNNNYSQGLENPAFVERYAAFWKALAGEAAKVLDPEWLIFQPMNEPVFDKDPAAWPPVQEKIVAAIRASAPAHWIVGCGARWQSREELVKMTPLADRRMVYDFHFYDPFPFTHQGASWVGGPVRNLKGVPYPGTPERAAAAAQAQSGDAERREVERMGREGWNAAKMDAEMARMASWSKQHGVPVICTEFGVYARVSPLADRLQWHRDVRAALEKHGIGWAVWNYREEFFGVARYPEPGKPELRADLVDALIPKDR